MVYPDISTQYFEKNKNDLHQEASFLQRMLSVLLDYFILSPIVSFIVVSFFSDGVRLYKQFPQSTESQLILFQMGLGFIFFTTLIQAVFMTVVAATPGQIFTKLYVRFDTDVLQDSSWVQLFFLSWIRQLGFVVSLFCLGLPWISILYHKKRRAFYERMTESSVLTTVNHPQSLLRWGESERKYVAVFVNTFLLFSTSLLVLGFGQIYHKTLTSNLTYDKLNKEDRFCKELDGVKQENRLSVATALNLVGVLSDRCLDLEADFILWRNFSDQAQSDLKASAYFAKYLTAENDQDEQSYLSKTCQQDSDSKACVYAQGFLNDDVQDFYTTVSKFDSDIFNDALKYELTLMLGQNPKNELDQLEKYSTHKLVNKFIIQENLKSLKPESGRFPASVDDLSEKIENIQKRIESL
jgi:hypothetical protein